jgi:hypothetical protein
VQLRDSSPSLLFFSFFFSFFSILSHVFQALSLAYKREGLVPFEGGRLFKLSSKHTHSQVLKPPLPSTKLVAQATSNWTRDILPKPVYIFASSKLTIQT